MIEPAPPLQEYAVGRLIVTLLSGFLTDLWVFKQLRRQAKSRQPKANKRF
jgi:hypothetical protein